jgi:hypothetical protein
MEMSTTVSQTPEMLAGMPKVGLGVHQTYEAETGLKTSGGVGAEGGVGCDKSQNYKYSGKPNSVRPDKPAGVSEHDRLWRSYLSAGEECNQKRCRKVDFDCKGTEGGE